MADKVTIRIIGDRMAAQAIEYDTPYKSEFFKDVPTCALVEELRRREGVQAYSAGPDGFLEVKQPGPAIMLVVID